MNPSSFPADNSPGVQERRIKMKVKSNVKAGVDEPVIVTGG
jgi:hypothetical protein